MEACRQLIPLLRPCTCCTAFESEVLGTVSITTPTNALLCHCAAGCGLLLQEALEHAWVGVQHRQQLRSSQRLSLLTSFRSSPPNLGSLPESAMRPGELPHVLLERMRTYAHACPLKRAAMLQVRCAGVGGVRVVMSSLCQSSQSEAGVTVLPPVAARVSCCDALVYR